MKTVLFYLFFYDLFYVYNCVPDEYIDERYETGLIARNTSKETDENQSVEEEEEHRLTCIVCNNVDTRSCSRPSKNYVHSEKCPRVTDRCLSIHTPFGIVTRGCYDIVRKQVLYFCACDLCNNVPVRNVINYMKTGNKKKWAQNVADLSHARRLRHSTKKGLKCLVCSVSWTDTNDLDRKNEYTACVEGQTRDGMSTEVCQEKDVCGIRIVKLIGSVVRGCVSGPVYNYFYKFCNHDFCNDDPVVSVYDPD